jgi:hypothetical protein
MKLHMTFPQLYGKYPEGNIYEMKRVNIFWYVFLLINPLINFLSIDSPTEPTRVLLIDCLYL